MTRESVLPTRALYQYDEKLRTHSTQVLSVQSADALPDVDRALFKQITLDSDHYVVATTETIFYAQGGGQPCDTGVMRSNAHHQAQKSPADAGTSVFWVHAVRHSVSSPGVILHLGRWHPDASKGFMVGQAVHQSIDGEKREINSRIHTGGHIVGLAVRHLAKGSGERLAVPDLAEVTELKAQHYPDAAFVEFRGLIDRKHKGAIQTQCDAFMTQSLPVKVYWWDEAELREKCAIVPENVALPVVAEGGHGQPGLVRAVDIEGAGAYPCGGTHVPDTGVVGKLEIKKISRSKGISKVSYTLRQTS